MDWAYDLSNASVATLRKFQVAATNTVLGRIYLKVASSGSGVVLGGATDATDFVGINIDAAGTYVTAQQTDSADTARLTTLSIGPLAVYKARLSGGATDGTALTARTVTTASTDGLVITTSAYDPNSPDMDEGVVWGYTGANAGKARKITSTAANAATVTVAFPNDTAVGDTFLFAPFSPLSTIIAQSTTNSTELDATAAISGDCECIVVEMLLGDSAGEGLTQSYAYIQFADSLLGATIT